MEFILIWATVMIVQATATMSPGPAFAMAIRHAMNNGRQSCIGLGIGLGLGIGVHITFVILGMAVIISKSIVLFNAIKYFGAAYLIYIGYKGLKAQKKNLNQNQDLGNKIHTPKNTLKSVYQGFMTNLLNPKALVFFTAIFAQFITPDMTITHKIILALSCMSIETLWFGGLGFFLTNPLIKKKFEAISHWIDRTCGGLLIALGIKLAISKA